MPSKTLHVFRSIAGWEVKKEGRQSKTFGTKRDALAMAIHQAKNSRAAQVVVHRRDGRVAELRYFGMRKILKSTRKSPLRQKIAKAVGKVVMDRLRADSPRDHAPA